MCFFDSFLQVPIKGEIGRWRPLCFSFETRSDFIARWPRAHGIMPASVSDVLGLKACATATKPSAKTTLRSHSTQNLPGAPCFLILISTFFFKHFLFHIFLIGSGFPFSTRTNQMCWNTNCINFPRLDHLQNRVKTTIFNFLCSPYRTSQGFNVRNYRL